MPNIKPVSDLRNYGEVLRDVAVGQPVFLTKNGRGRYVIMDIRDYERREAMDRLMRELEAGIIYKLNNITLKGLGSEYSNFYERKYEGDLTPFSVEGWSDCEIDNIDMGYKDYGGTEIY